MANIVKWHWDFGDGGYSSQQSPFHIYKTPGFYTVTLTVVDSMGISHSETKTSYVRVYSYADAIYDFGGETTCLVLGFGNGNGSGWSEFSGNEWLVPESTGAITKLNIGDDNIKIVFDFDTGLPFVINTFGDGVYKDKVGHPDNLDGFPIVSKILTPEIIGADRKFRIKHDETFIDLRAVDGGSFDSPIEIDMHLMIDGDNTATETIQNIASDREILFSDKKLADRVQVLLELSESGYKISGIETSCIVSDTSRYSSDVYTTDIAFQTYFGTPTQWFTRPMATINRSTGLTVIPQTSFTPHDGPDRYALSAMEFTEDVALSVTSDSVLYLWYPKYLPLSLKNHENDTVIPTNNTDEFDMWVFAEYNVVGINSIRFESGSVVFDIRSFDSTLTNKDVLSGYTQDVTINRGQKFLPGYAE